jgi:hypothetical protein
VYSEDDLISVSALQHVLFCERQYAFVYLEQAWGKISLPLHPLVGIAEGYNEFFCKGFGYIKI